MKEDMTLEEFKEMCKKEDSNIVKTFDTSKFQLKCKKCESYNVHLVNDLSYEIGGGCPTCGSWLEGEGSVIIKCADCGQGMTIIKPDENKYR